MNGLDSRLLGRLACPVCRGAFVEEVACLVCLRCRLAFPIREGVPILLPGRAKKVRTTEGDKVG